MFKFGKVLEPNPKNPMQASYANIPMNEYLGSKIVEALGIPAQEVLLGQHNGRSVVACRDFVRAKGGHFQLVEFNKLETSMPGGSSSGKATPEYEYTLKVFEEHPSLEPIREAAVRRFWETAIVDALIGNFDRHSGNWGYILDTNSMTLIDLAPVYDCGSALYSRLSEAQMEKFTADREALAERIMAFPAMKLLVDGKKPKYHEFLLSEKGSAARSVLLDVYPRLDMAKIGEIVQNTPGISDVRKDFYRALLEERKRMILEPAYKQALAEVEGRKRERTPEAIAKAAREAAANGPTISCRLKRQQPKRDSGTGTGFNWE
ncbi:hypothetical protein B5F41_05805 [Gordonibacter sp. An232A]|nr:hypothetical protein B5F41_05805 [Gordonibacter sp. An232A]